MNINDLLGDLEKLEKISLVSKVCTELENHLGINDKDLAEFIIHLAEQNDTFDAFKKALIENGADSFPDSFIANLLRIIQHMKTTSKAPPKVTDGPITIPANTNGKLDVQTKKILCPVLALPNEPKPIVSINKSHVKISKFISISE